MNITKNGVYPITPKNHRFSSGSVFSTGTQGAATLKLGYKDKNGTITELTDGSITIPEQKNVQHGQLADIVLTVTNADGSTDFNVEYRGLI